MDDRLKTIRERILHDRSAGSARSLAEYALLFPGEDAVVARAYAGVQGGGDVLGETAGRDSIAHYRLLRELGRGGQGVVHLAEDTRLHRRVALKVLTHLGPGSEGSIDRFRREAEVASKLEHPGICGIHDAGVSEGVPYIAMHYVEGITLAERIAAMRRGQEAGEPTVMVVPSGATGPGPPPDGDPPDPPIAVGSSKQEIHGDLQIFAKAARALHAAHEAGVVHRDIKPGNIMVTAREEPVILDFGLARAEEMDLQTLTRTGDVIGTPAYMSPEQISGQRIRLDRRTDVYSLGVTLYECLTLRRPFEAATREGVYQAVMTKPPPDPRRLQRGISRDLKVVLETALEKDRDRRYASAEALARDLEAVVDGRPIQARPPGAAGRIYRWSKREPAKAALLVVLLVALPVIAALLTSHFKDRPHVEAARLAGIEQARDEVLSEASFELSEGSTERAAVLYAEALEMEGGSPEAAGGLVMAHLELRNAGLAQQIMERHRELLGDGAAAPLLRAYALHVRGLKDEAAAMAGSAPPPVTAFEHYLLALKELQKGEAGDVSGFRRALHHATTANLLSPGPRLSLQSLRAHAAGHLQDRDAVLESVAGLRNHWPRRARARYWAGFALESLGEAWLDAAVASYRESIRLRPDEGHVHHHLAQVLARQGRPDEALPAYREAARLRPGDAQVRRHLARALVGKGLLEDAIAAYRESLRLRPDDALVHGDLGHVLYLQGLIDEAMAAYREAIRLGPGDSWVHYNLGVALRDRGLFDDAIVSFRESIRLDPGRAEAHTNLGFVLKETGHVDEAIAAYREAIRRAPGLAEAHVNLGVALRDTGHVDYAIAAQREAIRLKPGLVEAHRNLGLCFRDQGLLGDAVAAHREAIRLRPGEHAAHSELGATLLQMGFADEALGAHLEAVRLDPARAEYHCNAARTLQILQRYRESLAAVSRGHDLASAQPGWSHPSDEWVAEARQLLAREEDLEAKLVRHLAEGTEPDEARDLVALARVALDQGHPLHSARWFKSAFEDAPALASAHKAGHRRLAARAAVLAANSGSDAASGLDDSARAEWRRVALSWLEAEVALVRQAHEEDGLEARQVRLALVPLVRNPAFAPVRDAEALARLGEEERRRWSELWKDLGMLLSELDDGKQAPR